MIRDLDRKIVELKGWRVEGDTLISMESGISIRYWMHDPDREWWSTSDSKALELVDELAADQADGFGARFMLIRWEAKGDKPARWEARFEPYWVDGQYTMTQVGRRFDGEAPTRPEAISRAYIAAVTWLKEKGK